MDTKISKYTAALQEFENSSFVYQPGGEVEVPSASVCYSESERKEEAKKRLEKRLEKRENT